jgi:predicted PurR-regulated permease PerM
VAKTLPLAYAIEADWRHGPDVMNQSLAPHSERPRGGAPPSWPALAVFIAALLVIIALTVHMLASFFGATVIALVMVALAYPLYERIHARLKSPVMATGIVTAGLILLVVLPVTALAVSFVEQVLALARFSSEGAFASELASLLRGEGNVADRVRETLARVGFEISTDDVAAFVDNAFRSGLSIAYARVSSLAGDTVTLLIHFGYMAVLIAGLLYYGSALKRFIFDLSPLPDDEEQMLVDRFNEMSRAVFLGNGVASALQGVFGGFAFAIFEVGPSVVWGTIITVLAFLPLVGASIIFLPAALYVLLRSGVGVALLYLLFSMAVTGVLEYWLKPRLIGNRSSLPAVLIFVGILAGIATYGVLGLFLGPLLLTVFLTLVELWRKRYRGQLFPDADGPRSDP